MRLALLPLLPPLLLLAACARPERASTHADWLREATRTYPGETKARLIAAAETAVKHADPGDTQLEYSRQGFVARRRFFLYAVLASVEGDDRWTFHAAENAAGASASVRVIRRGSVSAGRGAERFRENQIYLGGLRLFWARMDYLLGRRPDWIRCSEAAAKLALPHDAPGLDSLCGITHGGAEAAAPPRPQAQASAALKAGLPEPPQIAEGGED